VWSYSNFKQHCTTRTRLSSSDLCSPRRFTFTQPIIALVTVDQAPDSRQDSQFNQGFVQELCQLCSCIPIWECLVHDWIWSSTGVQWRRQMFATGEGYRKNQTYRKPFTCAVRTSLTGNEVRPSHKNFFWLAEMQFPADLRGLLALFILLLVDMLSRSQFLPHPTLFRCHFEQSPTPNGACTKEEEPVGSMLSPFWHWDPRCHYGWLWLIETFLWYRCVIVLNLVALLQSPIAESSIENFATMETPSQESRGQQSNHFLGPI